MTTTYDDAWVCEHCYIAHLDGFRPVDGDEPWETASGAHGRTLPLWWVGDGDAVTDREPLALLPDVELTDDTCPDHNGAEADPCSFCGSDDPNDGVLEFHWGRCDGCGSTLGGSRYRLALWHARTRP